QKGVEVPAWGMVIDLNACIGCNACTIACQAENNISTVGKDQVLNHRQMHWIRIDTYYSGDLNNPDVVFEPLPCMHCEKARWEAEKEDRVIRDGDVLTACQQACPTQAIVFGNVNDAPGPNNPGSHVRRLKESPLDFTLLTELNTRPRTSYLAKLRNPNPALA